VTSGERTSRALPKLLAALVGFSILASAALYAEFNAGYYSAEQAGRIRQTFSPASSSGPTYDAGAYPLFPPSLPAGAGGREVEAYCNTCHGSRYITMQPPFPPETWAAEVNKMIKTYGASIPDDATQEIIRYLQANFSVGTRKE
jgi:hypothetical protein